MPYGKYRPTWRNTQQGLLMRHRSLRNTVTLIIITLFENDLNYNPFITRENIKDFKKRNKTSKKI